MTGRLGALAALGVLTGALVATVLLTTPWRALPGGAPTDPPAPRRDFSLAEIAREDAFHAAVRPPAYAALIVALGLALVLGLTPLGGRLVESLSRPFGSGTGWQLAIGTLALPLLGRLVTLPFSARAEVVLRRFGLSRQTWGAWALDQAKGYLLSSALLLLVVLALHVLARALPTAWWLPAALGGATLVVAVSFVFPLVVEPVFNRFTPMPPGPLRSSLLELAERDDVPVRDVLVADASRRTSALNAYVSGFGPTRRIVVYDTLLNRATREEVELVVAHELGHAKRDDVLHGTLIGALGTAAAVCVLALALSSPRLLAAAGASGPADPRALALLLATVSVLTTLGGPVQMLVSRRVEARADVHALQLTGEPAAFARMQRRLAVANLSDLDPPRAVYVLFTSHPTAPQRIALARSWARLTGAPVPPPLTL